MPMQIMEDENATTEHTIAEDALAITNRYRDPIAGFSGIYVDYRQSGRRLDCRVHPYVRRLLFCLDEQHNR
jgi:hypothetical protein